MSLEMESRGRTLSAYVLQTLALLCILGMDFLTTYGIVVNFAGNTWRFADDITQQYSLEIKTTNSLSATLVRGDYLLEQKTEKDPTNQRENSQDSAPEKATDFVGHPPREGGTPAARKHAIL